MNTAGQRTAAGIVGGRGAGSATYLIRRASQVFWFVVISAGLFWLVWIYGNGLRDPRYLDGWVLAVGMGVQLYFHIATKRARLAPKSALRWRKLHIFVGYVLMAVFISHSDFSLPDTTFEWMLWAGFLLVAISGVLGTYLAWSLKTKRQIDEGLTYDRIPTRRAELARDLRATISSSQPVLSGLDLPAPPYDAWIKDLYTVHLESFFQGNCNFAAHLMGSQRPLKQMTDEIDSLMRYVDQKSQEKLVVIRALVVEKDRLDFARVQLGLTKAWLFVHVPITYALIVISVLHIIVVYAYSSGLW